MRDKKIKNFKKTIYVILVLIWMFTVFCYSNEQSQKSTKTSKKTVEIIINTVDIKHKIPENKKTQTIELLEPITRKLAHYSLYTIGGILIINFFNQTTDENKKKILLYSITLGVFYATTDEIHQYFVPGRSSQVTDILIDTLGICTGVVIFLIAKEIVYIISNNKSKINK